MKHYFTEPFLIYEDNGINGNGINRDSANTVRHVYCYDVICLIKIEEDNEVSIHVKQN